MKDAHRDAREKCFIGGKIFFLWNSLIPPPFCCLLFVCAVLRFFFIHSAMPLLSSQTSVESPSWSLYFNVACESAVMYQSGENVSRMNLRFRALTLAWWLDIVCEPKHSDIREGWSELILLRKLPKRGNFSLSLYYEWMNIHIQIHKMLMSWYTIIDKKTDWQRRKKAENKWKYHILRLR